MLKSIALLLNPIKVVVKSDRIQGNYSAGRKDTPGIWWKS
jgi:hypothetical protein